MPTYLFAYRAPQIYEGGSAEHITAWNAWFEDIGSSVLDRGNPVIQTSALGDCATNTVLGGYSLISAADLAAAVKLALGCPLLQPGGDVEVGELTIA